MLLHHKDLILKKLNCSRTLTKKSKADVEKLFGEPVSTAPIQKTEEGCIELWIYTEVIFDGIVPVKTEFLYVGFDEKGFVCSAKVTEEKM
jgi:hypothetical protein